MTATRKLGVLLASVLISAATATAATPAPNAAPDQPAEPSVHSKTVMSKVFEIDRKYRSMMGPYSQEELYLAKTEEPEILWITGYEAVMVNADGSAPMQQEFMCHSNLDLDVIAHRSEVGVSASFSPRLFTLSQGQFSIVFPEGFGLPVSSRLPLALTTQVLNHNIEGETFDVRHKVTISYVRNRELRQSMKALFPIGAYGLALLEGDSGYFGVEQPDREKHGPGCLVTENASDHTYSDHLGRTFTGHWQVKPGREVNHTLVTGLMRIPYDTTIHYIAVHLHPFAESLELRDLTAGETLFKSLAENLVDRIGLTKVDSFQSVEGIAVFRDHEYELVSTYNNTTNENQDSMAVMYLYLRDLEAEKHLADRLSDSAAVSVPVPETAPPSSR